MNGIGSYFSPVSARPVGPRQTAPLTGFGAYFTPVPTRSVRPPSASPISANGLGVGMEVAPSGSNAALAILVVLALGFLLLRKK